ncbi:acetoacetate decarboxylase family protein [Nocardia blacklockiae]|uniref:acetoacetate decarboxylase family protein n=1 Tax=Nocardia blacklockiae TaxID=480036 RepID=UPI0018961ABE|nr:acetoacetate decarboxylase family protein [Nocardia blacklockiae]MBF6173278.1 acetoacetate decarboxylase family protein [Nocardia blacklockiae]
MHSILGEQIRVPVEVRQAEASSSLFPVDSAVARSVLAGTGLEPVRVAGRALCALAFVRHLDTDLGPYHEFAYALLARLPGRRGSTGAYIRWLPVNQTFTCAVGRELWGFPKEIADIRIERRGRGRRCEVRLDDRLVLALDTAGGVPAPANLGGAAMRTYTYRDGVLRGTPWLMEPARVRMRLGGSRIELGDHPIANELRALGLPARALFTSHIGALRMAFEDATEIR